MASTRSRVWTAWLSTIVLAIVASSLAPRMALAITTGTFNLDGTMTLSGTGLAPQITFTQNVAPFPPNKATIGPGATGSFAALGGTTASIQNVSNPPAVTGGAGFAPQSFLSFDAAPALGTLPLNFIFAGINSAASCGAAPAVGQVCSPANTPFNFQNVPGGGSTLSFVFQGISNPAGSTWTGIFTSQFHTPYQTVLATLATGGAVTNTYSATFNVVPEPTSLALVLGGLGILVGVSRRRTH
jgi:PEP-CTERM motif-containing protein